MIVLSILLVAGPEIVVGQATVYTQSSGNITISRGGTARLDLGDTIAEVSIADDQVADVVFFPNRPNEVLINAVSVGSTTLMVWGRSGVAEMYTVEVTADIASLQRTMDDLYPGAGLTLSSTGTAMVLSGEVRDPGMIRKAMELAETEGIPVVNNVEAPGPEQILLHVEFAEVSKSTLKEIGGDLVRLLNPSSIDEAFGSDDTHVIETISEGFVNLMVQGDGARLDMVIRALKNTGEFRSLAQPNLVTREGESASFLAGGEFPFPTIQGGGNSNAVTITWKEFGIKLDFTPTITNTGNISLHVVPEVSSLDFANGLTYQGFNIPSILARRVETEVELRSGQTLAIGGLVDNKLLTEVDKIPLLGDIPILGFFFKSEAARQDRTELLVLVTPYLLDQNNLPVEALPTGPAEDWDWDKYIREWMDERALMKSGNTMGIGGH